MSTKKNYSLRLAVLGCCLLLAAVLLTGCAVAREFTAVREMPIRDVDLSRIPDGTYVGNFSYYEFTYEVEVEVEDNRIAQIKVIKNRDTKRAKKAEGVIKRVLEAQTPNVDASTGATTTSKALLKAIENGLLSDRTSHQD